MVGLIPVDAGTQRRPGAVSAGARAVRPHRARVVVFLPTRCGFLGARTICYRTPVTAVEEVIRMSLFVIVAVMLDGTPL